MIARNTVLILGAGASKPFGFPSGRELVNIVTEELQNPTQTALGKFLIGYGYEPEQLKEFAHNLLYSQRNSVDAFLEHRPEFIPIGKAAIASVLIQKESPNDLFSDGDWYRYLFQMLNTSFDEFEKNKISFVTFNYDRSLEYYLVRSLKAAYGKGVEEAEAKVSAIPIVHLHGMMGEILGSGQKYRDYSPSLSREAVALASSQIKIVHENIGEDPKFKEAHKLLAKAEVVCFLGFGYDRTNVRRFCPTIQLLLGKLVYGTAFGLTGAEQVHVRKILNVHDRIYLGNSIENCLEFLRNQGVLH